MNNSVLTDLKLQDSLSRVREIILSSADRSLPMVKECISSIIESGGKMLRPAFLITVSGLGSADPEKILRLAAGVELLHISSLIHDDIIDNSDMRRGKPAAHKVYGVKNSVLLGDYFFARSISLLAENRILEKGSAAAETAGRIIEGEILQADISSEKDFSLRGYLRQITGKTAALFILSFHLGAEESGCSSDIQSILRKTAYNTGIAFQIIDDILDFTGSEKTVGKPLGNDLRNRIVTAPVVYAVKKDPALIKKLTGKRPMGKRAVRNFIKRAEDLGAVQSARELALLYTERALKEISLLPEGSVKDSLNNIIKDLLLRDY